MKIYHRVWIIKVVKVLKYFYGTELEVTLELPDDTLGTKILTQWQKGSIFSPNQIVIIILHVNVDNKGLVGFVKTRLKFKQ